MVRNWKTVLKADPKDWLLERENPSVRYLTLRDLLEYSENDPEVEERRLPSDAIKRFQGY